MATVGTQLTPVWYKPFEDDDAEYKVAPLSNSVYMDVLSSLTNNGMSISGAGLLMAFQAGVKDWKKVFDDDGKESKLTRANIENLERRHFVNVANHVIDMSHLGLEEAKNL